MSKFCTQCRRKLNDMDKFCTVCGIKQAIEESAGDEATVSTSTTLENRFNENKILEKELGKVGFKSGMIGGFIGGGLLSAMGGASGGRLGASWAASKLPTDEVHDKIAFQKNLATSMAIVVKALSTMGTIIEASQYTDYPVVSACCGSGFANMNPAVLCVEFVQSDKEETYLYISGYAKEGLIKQKTAIKAIDKLKSILKS